MKTRTILILFFMGVPALSFTQAGYPTFRTKRSLKTSEARQGVAVDDRYFYAVNSKAVGKYSKETGKPVAGWNDSTGKIIHLDGGVVIGDTLWCAHSNYPGIPMTSSVEIFSVHDLKHIGSHSFGSNYGSCTWADFYNDSWWVCFAHYDQFRKTINKGTESTLVVRFDKNWNEKEAWCFPQNVIAELKPMSASGGSWGPDGLLYVTGHDSAKVYILRLPESGSVLEYVRTTSVASQGQGIAWDRSEKNILYGIIRKDNTVVVSELFQQQ